MGRIAQVTCSEWKETSLNVVACGISRPRTPGGGGGGQQRVRFVGCRRQESDC